jgi:hypothetical protein
MGLDVVPDMFSDRPAGKGSGIEGVGARLEISTRWEEGGDVPAGPGATACDGLVRGGSGARRPGAGVRPCGIVAGGKEAGPGVAPRVAKRPGADKRTSR